MTYNVFGGTLNLAQSNGTLWCLCEGVELARTVTELRGERERLDQKLTTVTQQQRLNQLNDTQQTVTSLQSQLDQYKAQVRGNA